MHSLFSLFLAIFIFLSACAHSIYAPDEALAKYQYISKAPPYIELLTMVDNKTAAGDHSSLVINNQQVVMYDPAGNWWSQAAPERNDILFGITPALLQRYKSWHAGDSHHIIAQRLYLSATTADAVYQSAITQGAAPPIFCTNYISKILQRVDKFNHIKTFFLPNNLMKQFAQLQAIITTRYDNHKN